MAPPNYKLDRSWRSDSCVQRALHYCLCFFFRWQRDTFARFVRIESGDGINVELSASHYVSMVGR